MFFSVRALENPARPYVPSVVHAGGLHTKSPNPLPEVRYPTRCQRYVTQPPVRGTLRNPLPEVCYYENKVAIVQLSATRGTLPNPLLEVRYLTHCQRYVN